MKWDSIEPLLGTWFRLRGPRQPIPDSGHLFDDPERVACLTLGTLPPEETELAFRHYDDCPECRDYLTAVLEVEGWHVFPSRQPKAQPGPERWSRRRSVAALVGLAASLLLVWVAVEGWMPGKDPLDQAEAALVAGRPEDAVRLLRPLLPPEGLPGTSARFRNLWLQARSGESRVVALGPSHSLLNYGYELDGFSPFKGGIPLQSEEMDQLESDWRQAVTDYPGDANLLLNAGRFLLARREPIEAERLFRRALRAGADPAAGHLGLGMAMFDQGEFEQARAHFHEVVRTHPRHLAGNLNLAITLEQLGRADEARPFWKTVIRSGADPDLVNRVEQHLHP
jgi:tetratricopeptide (TPR) repeat protein